MAVSESLSAQLDRLAAFEAGPYPVLSLAASIRFIEDAELLKPFGGVGAFLRFTL